MIIVTIFTILSHNDLDEIFAKLYIFTSFVFL